MSNDLNQCSFIGRLGKDPETRYMTSGKAVTSFSIAVGSQWKDKAGEKQESTEWVNITAFDKLAEICGEYLKKGSQVFIGGRMKTDKYQDKETGADRYSTKIIAETMQMLGGKPQGDGDQSERSAPAANPYAAPSTKANFDNFDDDIPF
jgi:single-strand DNA-binding protein